MSAGNQESTGHRISSGTLCFLSNRETNGSDRYSASAQASQALSSASSVSAASSAHSSSAQP